MIPIITGLCALAPTIAKWIGGDTAGKVTEDVVNMAKTITGQTDDQAALAALQGNPEMAMAFRQAWFDYDVNIQRELTARNETDMNSDSWLSKNVRPLCLLGITVAITTALFVPSDYVSADKFQYLADMSQWIYGYYFLARSAFDKNHINMNFPSSK